MIYLTEEAQSMISAVEAERDEWRRRAWRRGALIGGLLGIIEHDGERVASAMELLGIETRDELLAAAQSEIAA